MQKSLELIKLLKLIYQTPEEEEKKRSRCFLNSLYTLHFLWYALIILQSLHIQR